VVIIFDLVDKTQRSIGFRSDNTEFYRFTPRSIALTDKQPQFYSRVSVYTDRPESFGFAVD
jgi:hypothetical protein